MNLVARQLEHVGQAFRHVTVVVDDQDFQGSLHQAALLPRRSEAGRRIIRMLGPSHVLEPPAKAA